MSSDTSIGESLKEIASLLLLVQEHYVSSKVGPDVTLALAKLINEVGIIKSISVLDSERLRRQVMRWVSSPMDAQPFYFWLRDVAALSYEERDLNGRKALHQMLTQCLVPAMSEWEGTITSSAIFHSAYYEPLRYLTESAWKVLVTYSEFFHHLFMHLLTANNDGAKSSHTYQFNALDKQTIWMRILQFSHGHGRILSSSLVNFLEEHQIIPKLITRLNIKDALSLAVSSSDDASHLSFSEFLYCFELLSERLELDQLTNIKNVDVAHQNRLLLLINILTRNMFESLVLKTASEFDGSFEEIAHHTIITVLHATGLHYFTPTPWFLRCQRSADLIVELLKIKELRSYRESMTIKLADTLITDIFHLILEIDTIPVITHCDTFYTHATNNLSIKSTLILAEFIPAIFFTIPSNKSSKNPPKIFQFYEQNFAQNFQQYYINLQGKVCEMMSEAHVNDERYVPKYYQNVPDLRYNIITAGELELILDRKWGVGGSVGWGDRSQLREVVSSVCGMKWEDNPWLSSSSIIEVLFLLLVDDSSDDGGSCDGEALYEAICDYLDHGTIPPSAKSTKSGGSGSGGDVLLIEDASSSSHTTAAATAADEDVLLQSTEAAGASSKVFPTLSLDALPPPYTASPTIPASSASAPAIAATDHDHDVHREIEGEEEEDDQSVVDLIKLLLHFPSNYNFQPSPWEIHSIFTDTLLEEQNSSFDREKQVEISTFKVENANVTLKAQNTSFITTKFLSCLSEKFSLSSQHFSSFFAYYYHRDSHLRHMQMMTLKSSFLRCLMSSFNVMRLLSMNEDLLKWEFSKCFACCAGRGGWGGKGGGGEPFTQHLIAPLLIGKNNNNILFAVNLTHIINWFNLYTAASSLLPTMTLTLSVDRIEGIFIQSSILSSTPQYLTFSTFTIFICRLAIALYSPQEEEQEVSEDMLLTAIRKILKVFSSQLTIIQRTLELHILTELFSSDDTNNADNEDDDNDNNTTSTSEVKIVTFATRTFDSYITTQTTTAKPRNLDFPPKPPSFLVDFPRFLEFCRFFSLSSTAAVHDVDSCLGVISVFASIFVSCYADKVETVKGIVEYGVIPPLPLEVNEEVWLSLLHAFDRNDDGKTHVENVVKQQLLPMCISMAELQHQEQQVFDRTQSGIMAEDLFRLGGARLLLSLDKIQGFLKLAFYCLQQTSQVFLDQSLVKLPLNLSSNKSSSSSEHGEIPLNVACNFFSCQELIKTAKVGFLAKDALTNRNRPTYAVSSAVTAKVGVMEQESSEENNETVKTPNIREKLVEEMRAVVTMNYCEFEELCLRSAYYIHTTLPPPGNSTNIEKNVKIKNSEKDSNAMFIYHQAHDKLTSSSNNAASSGGGMWGVDYLTPYVAVLQNYFEFPVTFIEAFQQQGGFNIPTLTQEIQALLVSKQQFGSSNDTDEQHQQPEVKTRSRSRSEGEGDVSSSSSAVALNALEVAVNNNFSHIIADPIARSSSLEINLHTSMLAANSYLGSIIDPAVSNNDIGNRQQLPETAEDSVHATTNTVGADSAAQQQQLTLQTAGQKRNVRFADEHGQSLTHHQHAPSSPSSSVHSTAAGYLQHPRPLLYDHTLTPEQKQATITNAKESLWPVFATYCSCGDSLDPGKLSGPNLFTLLSKLGVLTDQTLFSDVGRIFVVICMRVFHRAAMTMPLKSLSRHTTGSNQSNGNVKQGVIIIRRRNMQQSLSFEEFLLFLFAFAQLRYEDRYDLTVDSTTTAIASATAADEHSSSEQSQPAAANTRKTFFPKHGNNSFAAATSSNWQAWFDKMASSTSFRRLLSDAVLPTIQRHALLAFPEDARLRDRFTVLFSPQVLEAIESVEGSLFGVFRKQQAFSIGKIVEALKRLELVPSVLPAPLVVQLVRDVLPEGGEGSSGRVLFPQWVWVLSVIAFQAVDAALMQSEIDDDDDDEHDDNGRSSEGRGIRSSSDSSHSSNSRGPLVAKVIVSITDALLALQE